MSASPPLISIAIEPQTAEDRQRLERGLQQLTADDPRLRAHTDRSGHVVLAAIGELHLEIAIDRLKREFDVEARVGRPQIMCKEALTHPAFGEGRFVGQRGGRGQYGHVKIRLRPGESGSGYVFESEIAGGSIPERFVESIDEGIRDALTRGVLAGYPIDDVRVELYDGSYHFVDSSDEAFWIAGSMAFQDAAKRAGPVILEPVMRVEVVVPPDYAADVVDNLSSRHGEIQSQEGRGGARIIRARVPMSRMLSYATDLRERTRGQATYTLHFERYERIQSGPDEGDRDAMVGAPLKPAPTINRAAIALPEPEDDALSG